MVNNDSATKSLNLNNTQGPTVSDRWNDYNLMVNVRLLYSFLVLMAGWSSRIQSASSVKRCISPLLVEPRIDRFSFVSLVAHLVRWCLTGPLLLICSLKRDCMCRLVWPT